MSDEEIVWEDPPPRVVGHYRNTKWSRVADKLKQQPGKWAFVAEGQRGGGSAYQHLKKRGFEIIQRSQPDHTFKVWARWPEDVS